MNLNEKKNKAANVREASGILVFRMEGIGESILIVEIGKEYSAGKQNSCSRKRLNQQLLFVRII